MNNIFNNIIFGTRSNDGYVQQHSSLNDALESFIAQDGYRLDFLFPDGKVLYIHRSDYDEDTTDDKLNHPAYKNYSLALAKVLLYTPSSTNDLAEIIPIN